MIAAEGLDRDALAAGLAHASVLPVFSAASDPAAIAGDWLDGIASEHDLLDAAFAFVANELGELEAELRAGWSARSERERRLWLEQCASGAAPPLRAALANLCTALETGAETQERLPLLRSLLGWFAQRERLALCLETSGPAGLRALLGLAEAAPDWPLLALVPCASWPSVREQLDDRSRTLLESGVLPIPLPPEHSPRDPASPLPEVAHAPAAPVDLRALSAEAGERARRARASGAPDAELLTERARSLAEARLFELLQAEPATRDLFALNRRLPFTFGRARAEVDLVCAPLRIAVEVDGYHHFQQSDAYRRDRRKDVLLQHQGYLVSRHLATDVVERAGEVVRAIRELVLRRRRSLRRENAT